MTSRWAARAWAPAAAVALAAVLPYVNALGNGFLTWDDNIIILGQPFLRELTLENLWRIVSPFPVREEWLPVRDLTLLLNFTLFGEAPWAFAAGNVLLHAATAVALLALFRRLGASPLAAVLGAAAFAVHAGHVESVTWLSGRKDPLSALFLVLAFITHIRWRCGEGRYWPVLPLLVIALLSKASAFVFPAWAVAYDLLYHRRLGWRGRVLPVLPYACLAGAEVLLFFTLMTRDGWIEPYPEGGLAALLWTNVVLLGDYTLAAIVPWRHQAIYTVAFIQGPFNWRFLGAGLVLAAVAGIAWRFRRRPWAPLAAILFYVNLAPYLNLIPHGIFYAERYLYLPSISFALVAGVAGARLLEAARAAGRAPRFASLAAIAVFFLLHALAVASRNTVWADSESFWRHQEARVTGNPAPLINLGETYELRGDFAAAARAYVRALERFGVVPEAYYRLGRVARAQGRLEEARELYARAASLSPGDPRPRNNLAEVHLALGETEAALALYEEIVAAHPRYLLARASLARTLEAAGRREEAAEHWRRLIASADLLPQEVLVREARTRLAALSRATAAAR